jgi:hypothetical protein
MTNEQMKQLEELSNNLQNGIKLVRNFEDIINNEPNWSPDFESLNHSLSQAREFLQGDISRMKEFLKGIDND